MEKNLPEGHVPFAFPDILDNTILSTYASCKRKSFFNHFLHLQTKTESIHLHAGAAYASALESFRKAYWSEGSPTKGVVIDSAVVGLRTLFEKYGYDEEQIAYQETTNKSCERMAEAFVRHCTMSYDPRGDAVKPYMVNGVPAIEKSFALELDIKHPDTGEPIMFHGRFDMIAEYMGGLFAYDDKTTSQLGVTWNNQWDFRSQFTGYCKGADQFGLKLLGAIVRGHCLLKNEIKFAEVISHRKQWQVDEWWEDLHNMVFDMIAFYQRAKTAYENGEDKFFLYKLFTANGKFNETCIKYSGCPYQNLCNNEHPQRYLNQYRVRVWDPRNPDAEAS